MRPELQSILCCPKTHQPLAMAEPDLVGLLNERIRAGHLRDNSGAVVTEPIEGGLIRQDRQVVYPIRNGLPILLIDAALVITPS